MPKREGKIWLGASSLARFSVGGHVFVSLITSKSEYENYDMNEKNTIFSQFDLI
jgi:hypothetical protein